MSGVGFQFKAAILGNLDEEIAAGRKRVEFATQAALEESGEELRDRLRLDVELALTVRLARTWRGKFYRNTGINPAYTVNSNAALIVQAFEEGEVVRSSSGLWLTIPNPELRIAGNARRRRRSGRSIVGEYEARFGPLRMVFLKGRRDLALLVTDLRRGKGASRRLSQPTPAARARGDYEETVVFYLVPQTKMPRLLRGAEIRRRAARDFSTKFERAFDRYLDQAERSQVALTFKPKGSAIGSD